jgi:FHA domain-containing protein
MVKLTLFFKGVQLEEFEFNKGPISIGRGPGNDVLIDSLAIAPQHALIELQGRLSTLRALDKAFPVLLNGVEVAGEAELKSGDAINVGKHIVQFQRLNWKPSAGVSGEASRDAPAEFGVRGSKAGLQIMNGKNIGMIMPLRSSLTRLGKPDQGYAIIAHRPDGFFLSTISPTSLVALNGQSIGDQTLPLKDGDTLTILGQELMFFVNK